MMRINRGGALRRVMLLFVALPLGCRSTPPLPPLPPYPWMDEQTAMHDLAARAAAVRTVSARCGLTLTHSDGQSVQFDGALAMAPPDRLRMQAMKFGQTVFDLTLIPDGAWIRTSDDRSRRDRIMPAGRSAAEFSREWSWFIGGFFVLPDLQAQTTASRMIVRRKLQDGRMIVCEVDRATLTPVRYAMADPGGGTRFTLTLANYRIIDGIYWPTRLTAISEGGRIDIQMNEVELNQPLSERAFVPPRRAEKLQ
jgi:outer membrane lipoprotein-sorting protein